MPLSPRGLDSLALRFYPHACSWIVMVQDLMALAYEGLKVSGSTGLVFMGVRVEFSGRSSYKYSIISPFATKAQ